MTDELEQTIQRAKEFFFSVRHAAMATVNDDGSPHNTPFFFMYDPTLTKIYWGSHPESLHSKNVERTGQIFVVLYDAHEKGGLYIRASNAHAVSGEELDVALNVHNTFRIKEGKKPLEKTYYIDGSPQRMYSATITNVWVLGSEKQTTGHLIKEYRQEITTKDLLR